MPLFGPVLKSLREHVGARDASGPGRWWRIATEADVRVRPVFAWYDLWIGVYVDRRAPALYVFPVPCVGVRIDWPDLNPPKREHGIPTPSADRADSLTHWARSEAALGRGSGMPWRKTRRRCAFCLPVTSKLGSPESKVCATCGGPIPG